MKCSIGVFAYNEEKNIGKLLEAILNQKTNKVEAEEIFVVASGCTDQTVSIAKEFEKKDARVKVLVQEIREGKYSAINLFLRAAKNDILVMESGDTIPEKDTIEKLVNVFEDPKVGIAGTRPIPINDPKTFLGFTTHLLWDLHHQISLKNPKAGEMVAFRKVFYQIPPTAVDEACIEGIIKNRGYKIVYVPEALVYNKGPESISDFLKQRRRIHCGHFYLKKTAGYEVSTMNPWMTFILVLKNIKFNFRSIIFTIGAILLEAWGKALGWWDYKIKRKTHFVWDMAKTTRDLNAKGNPASKIQEKLKHE